MGDGENRRGRRHSTTTVVRYVGFHATICMLVALFFVVVISFCLVKFTATLDTAQYLSEHKQLVDDWHSQPYVDITIVPISEGGCPAEYEPLFSLMWDGTKDLCITRAPEKAET